jgi:hypothetical protein
VWCVCVALFVVLKIVKEERARTGGGLRGDGCGRALCVWDCG